MRKRKRGREPWDLEPREWRAVEALPELSLSAADPFGSDAWPWTFVQLCAMTAAEPMVGGSGVLVLAACVAWAGSGGLDRRYGPLVEVQTDRGRLKFWWTGGDLVEWVRA